MQHSAFSIQHSECIWWKIGINCILVISVSSSPLRFVLGGLTGFSGLNFEYPECQYIKCVIWLSNDIAFYAIDWENFRATSHRSSQQNDIYRRSRHDLQFISSNPLTRHTCNRFSFWKHIDFNFRNRCQVNKVKTGNKTWKLNLWTKVFKSNSNSYCRLQKESAQEDKFTEEIYARKWFPKSFTENLKDVYLTCTTVSIQHTHTQTHSMNMTLCNWNTVLRRPS